MDIITMAKITIEAMLEHEVYKEEMDQKNNERDEFCSLLLKSDSKDTDKIHLMARHQMIDPGIPRFAIIFEVIDEDCSRQNVLDILYSSPGFTQQDIAFISKRQEIVLFKSMDKPLNQLFTEYKNHIRDFLIPVYEKLLKNRFRVSITSAACRTNWRITSFLTGTVPGSGTMKIRDAIFMII